MPSARAVHHIPEPKDFAAVGGLIGGHRIAQAIFTVAELGVADHLVNGPLPAAALTKAVGADEDTLYRILRFLAGHGVFAEVAPRTFALTALGATLRSDVPGSMRTTARMVVSGYHWTSWGQLSDAVRKGGTPFQRAHGMGLFSYLAQHPDDERLFAEAMTANTARAGIAIAERYDFARFGTIVDVGGGRGLLVATLLHAHRHLKGIVFDCPTVVADADPAAHGLTGRITFEGGDFFQEVPPGGDAYILRQIIHDWSDADAIRILQTCRATMRDGAKLLLIERRLADDHAQGLAQLHIDMEMLANLGGKERTDAEYQTLLGAAGLRLTNIVPLGDAAGFAVFEAEKAEGATAI